MSDPKKAEQKQVEVTLLKPHTHAGKSYDTGAKIKVDEASRDWLVANKVIETPKEAVR